MTLTQLCISMIVSYIIKELFSSIYFEKVALLSDCGCHIHISREEKWQVNKSSANKHDTYIWHTHCEVNHWFNELSIYYLCALKASVDICVVSVDFVLLTCNPYRWFPRFSGGPCLMRMSPSVQSVQLWMRFLANHLVKLWRCPSTVKDAGIWYYRTV